MKDQMTSAPSIVTIYAAPPAGVNVGSNAMHGVPFPLIVGSAAGDHYFHGYELAGQLVWDVFLWHPDLTCPMYEVKSSRPAAHGAWEIGQRAVLFQDDHDFELSLNSAQIEVTTTRGQITFDSNGVNGQGISVLNSTFVDCFAAYKFGADGSVAMGVGNPPAGMVLGLVAL